MKTGPPPNGGGIMESDKISPVEENILQEERVKLPEVVAKILELREKGWGQRRIALALGINRKTVQRYIRQNGWLPYHKPVRHKKLEGLKDWLEERFEKHKGNAAVIQQELLKEHNIHAASRTIQYAVKCFRQKLFAETHATVRFETPPGRQLQIDFGSLVISIGGAKQKVFLFVATLGYSRRQYVQAFLSERQTSWFKGMEGAFHHFGGITDEILFDNSRSLVSLHNPITREVAFTQGLHAFANYWKFKPKACAPYRPRTKGKDERSVGYVKKNCIAGREFSSWPEMEEHFSWWMREISDKRIHGTTGEKPIDRFTQEIAALRPLDGKPSFCHTREHFRVVHIDSCIEMDSNFYSVPWHLIKQSVVVHMNDLEVRILYEDKEVARHPILQGRRKRIVNPHHLKGIVRDNIKISNESVSCALLRPLAEYETVAGGNWS